MGVRHVGGEMTGSMGKNNIMVYEVKHKNGITINKYEELNDKKDIITRKD